MDGEAARIAAGKTYGAQAGRATDMVGVRVRHVAHAVAVHGGPGVDVSFARGDLILREGASSAAG